MAEQILRPRPGHDGKLTNRVCLKYSGSFCAEAKVTEYDLNDATFRDTANKLNFICKIGGRRFKICKDKPGFCRISYSKKCHWIFCGKEEREEEYLPSLPYQFVLDAKTACFSKDNYSPDTL